MLLHIEENKCTLKLNNQNIEINTTLLPYEIDNIRVMKYIDGVSGDASLDVNHSNIRSMPILLPYLSIDSYNHTQQTINDGNSSREYISAPEA